MTRSNGQGTGDTHLEALTGVAVAAAPDAQGKLVVQREEQRPGHILTINKEKLVIGDQQSVARVSGSRVIGHRHWRHGDMCHEM